MSNKTNNYQVHSQQIKPLKVIKGCPLEHKNNTAGLAISGSTDSLSNYTVVTDTKVVLARASFTFSIISKHICQNCSSDIYVVVCWVFIQDVLDGGTSCVQNSKLTTVAHCLEIMQCHNRVSKCPFTRIWYSFGSRCNVEDKGQAG